jgi:hypothetical protein
MALVRTDVLEVCIASIIRAAKIGELRTTLAVTSNRSTLRVNTNRDDGGDKFLRIVGSYKSQAALYPRSRHSSYHIQDYKFACDFVWV